MTDLTDYKQVALEGATIINANCIEVMASMPSDSVDAIVCDPPYGLEFMGKDWDKLTVQGGAGFSEDGMGKGFAALPSFKGSPNPSCRNCGGTQRGNDGQGVKRCHCDNPVFPNRGLEQSIAQQAWHLLWVQEALRVLKPGGHLLAFGGTRTYHRLAVAIEDAGFEIRDCLSWMYGSGFPKSMDVSKAIDKAAGATREVVGRKTGRAATPVRDIRGGGLIDNRPNDFDASAITAPATDEAEQWDGWGTALKPSWEPIIMARKPFRGTVANNVLEHGTGAINIAATRISHASEADLADSLAKNPGRTDTVTSGVYGSNRPQQSVNTDGRWPANSLLSHDDECGDECVEGCPIAMLDAYGGDKGGASRFFYCAKTPKKERNAGLPDGKKNDHPTVKPVNVMRWLVKMVTPPGGTVLDPFMGSGSTGIAALEEGFTFVGIDLESAYCNIAYHRLTHTIEKHA